MSMYMKIPNVMGGAKPKAYKNWIVVESVDIDADRSMTFATGQSKPDIGKIEHSNALIHKMRDSGSIALISAFYSGTVFDQITIDRCNDDNCVGRIILHNVTITRYQTHMHSNALDEELSLCFQKITHQHNPIDEAGKRGSQQIVNYCISSASVS